MGILVSDYNERRIHTIILYKSTRISTAQL